MRFEWKLVMAAAVSLCTASALAQSAAATSAMEIKIRNSVTGVDLSTSAAVEITDHTNTTSRAQGRREAALARQFNLPAGRKQLRFSAPGHKDAQANFELQAGERLPVKVLLDPDALPEELKPEVVKSKLQPGKALVHGHIVDDDTGRPLKGAVVRLEQAKAEAVTDDKGYFILNSLVPPAFRQANEIPASDTLIVRAPGYKEHRITGALLVEGATHYAIELEAGAGSSQRDDTHKLVQAARAAQLQGNR